MSNERRADPRLPYMSPTEVAALVTEKTGIPVSRWTILRRIEDGTLPATQLGGKRYGRYVVRTADLTDVMLAELSARKVTISSPTLDGAPVSDEESAA